MITIDTLKPEYATALEKLQRECFPTLEESALMVEEHFLTHCELFPEGNFVALADDQVVGLGSGFLINFDFEDTHHTFMEILDGGYYTRHDPQGDYYYGADISVHPAFRRRGIGGMLYQARKDIVRQLNRKGIVAGGVMPGYFYHKDHLTPHAYVDKVIKGEFYDSTLTFQLNHGFRIHSLLQDYIADTAADNWAALIVWHNPEYVPPAIK